MPTATLTPTTCAERPLQATLRRIHEAWVAETRRFLEPACDAGADFWARWAAVRYLNDDFGARCERERALMNELLPFLRPDVAERIVAVGERVLRLRLQLDRQGRRRGTGIEVACATRELIAQLQVWCAVVERAAMGLTLEDLPAEAAELLAVA